MGKNPDDSFKFVASRRIKEYVRAGVSGVSGSGKTLGALRMAGGLARGNWSKVFYIQLERNDKNAYNNDKEWGVGAYMRLENPITPPYSMDVVMGALRAAALQGAEVVVFDSVSLVWAGEGGILDEKERLDASYAGWSKVNPGWYSFINWIVADSPYHFIGTFRAEEKRVAVEVPREGGGKPKMEIKSLGEKEISRPNTRYEFNLFFAQNHETKMAEIINSKSGMFQEGEKEVVLDYRLGEILAEWADQGQDSNAIRYDNYQLVNYFNLEEVSAYEAYMAEFGKRPEDKEALRNWRRLQLEEQRKQQQASRDAQRVATTAQAGVTK